VALVSSPSNAAGEQTGSPVGTAVRGGAARRGLVVVRHGDEFHLPAISRSLDNRVARVRATGFHNVGMRLIQAIRGKADAARIHDERPVVELHGSRQMRMAAGDEGVRDGAEQLPNAGGLAQANATGLHVFEQICQV